MKQVLKFKIDTFKNKQMIQNVKNKIHIFINKQMKQVLNFNIIHL